MTPLISFSYFLLWAVRAGIYCSETFILAVASRGQPISLVSIFARARFIVFSCGQKFSIILGQSSCLPHCLRTPDSSCRDRIYLPMVPVPSHWQFRLPCTKSHRYARDNYYPAKFGGSGAHYPPQSSSNLWACAPEPSAILKAKSEATINFFDIKFGSLHSVSLRLAHAYW